MRRRTQSFSGWHPADVKAAIQKQGQTLTGLAIAFGFSESYLRGALIRPRPRAEAIIAEFLDVLPKTIWPERYDAKGNPKNRRRRIVFQKRRAA